MNKLPLLSENRVKRRINVEEERAFKELVLTVTTWGAGKGKGDGDFEYQEHAATRKVALIFIGIK